MTYLGWGVWTPDTELAHHGIPGMKWGDRNGPPYPLRPGARSGAEKKAGTPIADKFADASRKLKKKAAVSKAKRTRRKKAKYEHDRQEALRKGSADDILKYRGNLSNEEMETAYKRIQWENKLESLSKESRKNGMTKADKLLGNEGTIGKIKEYSGNIAGVMQNINKINKALKGDSGDEKEDKKDKKDKNKDKEKNIVINNYVNGEKVDDSSGSKSKEQQSGDKSKSKETSDSKSSAVEKAVDSFIDKIDKDSTSDAADKKETVDAGRSYVERNYTSLNNTESYQNYYKDKEAKGSSRNEYGGIDIKRYDRYMRHSMTYLEHTGIKGQKWGSRRFRNYDGKLTPAGKERYYSWDRKQITNQIPDGTFAYNEVDDEVYESVGGRMVAIDHNRPDYEERKAEARRAYETQKEIEEHFKHAYLGGGIYGIVDDRTYLAHHGVKGMHWGIRRYQPYPDGKSGKFIGKLKRRTPVTKLGQRLKRRSQRKAWKKAVDSVYTKEREEKAKEAYDDANREIAKIVRESLSKDPDLAYITTARSLTHDLVEELLIAEGNTRISELRKQGDEQFKQLEGEASEASNRVYLEYGGKEDRSMVSDGQANVRLTEKLSTDIWDPGKRYGQINTGALDDESRRELERDRTFKKLEDEYITASQHEDMLANTGRDVAQAIFDGRYGDNDRAYEIANRVADRYEEAAYKAFQDSDKKAKAVIDYINDTYYKKPSLEDLDKNIDKRLDELERSDQRVADIKKNHTGDGYEYTMKVLNATNDKKLSDAIKDYDDTYSKQESDRKAIAKAGGADSESTFKRMTQDPKNRSLGDRLEKASEDAEWAVERNDYSSAEERERAVRQARERQQSAYDELIKYERDTYGFSYVDYNRARGH